MSHFSQAIDEVRAAEARKLAAAGRAPVLKRSRWLLLKRPENLSDEQRGRLAELVRRNLRTVRAYLLKEDFQALWGYVSPYWAGRFLDRWCTRTMRSRLDPMKEVARMLRSHRDLILNWFRARRAVLQWHCRRLQREGQSDHQTGVWLPHLRGTGSRFISCTWRPARTRTHPQILLTRPMPQHQRKGSDQRCAEGNGAEHRGNGRGDGQGTEGQRPRKQAEDFHRGRGHSDSGKCTGASERKRRRSRRKEPPETRRRTQAADAHVAATFAQRVCTVLMDVGLVRPDHDVPPAVALPLTDLGLSPAKALVFKEKGISAR